MTPRGPHTKDKEAVCWQLCPAGAGDDLGRASGQRPPSPCARPALFLFLDFVFTLLSAHNSRVEPGTLLTPGLHSQCPALELLGLRVLCEWKVPAVLTITCKPVETIHFQTRPKNVWIFFKNCMQCQQTECL